MPAMRRKHRAQAQRAARRRRPARLGISAGIAFAPPDELWPNDPRKVKQQGDTNACTGFSLATVLEYLLERRPAKRAEDISGFMLYSMARRYDEWAEEDENEDSGSSLRGALKGWAKHGASCERLWATLRMPPAPERAGRRLVARRRQAAARRLLPHCARERARHARRAEGSRRRLRERADASRLGRGCADRKQRRRPNDPDAIPVIKAARGDADQGHAFAIVGYTRDGFIVHNSWGEEWGPAASPCCRTRTGSATRWTAGSCSSASRPSSTTRCRQGEVAARRAERAGSPSSRATRRWPITRSRRSSSTWRTRGGSASAAGSAPTPTI